METTRDILTALAWRYAFGDLSALIEQAADGPGAGDPAAAGTARGGTAVDVASRGDPGPVGPERDGAAVSAHPGAERGGDADSVGAAGAGEGSAAGAGMDIVARAETGLGPGVDAGRLRALCGFGQGLLDLDAEDFGAQPFAADGRGTGNAGTGAPSFPGRVPADLLARARASRMPQNPRERPRGALASLRPAYALLLEVIEARWRRREMAALVAVAHIAAEYLPLLAWEPVLGHAGDPARLGGAVGGDGSRFGVVGSDCAHHGAEQSAANRALRVAREPAPGWRAYLDRQHSHVARALGVCVAKCRRPCSVALRLDPGTRDALTERCQIAFDFGDSALVRLRHAAPVGHGFGVPSRQEVLEAWARTRDSLRKYPLARAAFAAVDGAGAQPQPQDAPAPRNPQDSRDPQDPQDSQGSRDPQDPQDSQGSRDRRSGRPEGPEPDRFPLPGLPALFSAVADAPIVPDTLLLEVARRIAAGFDRPAHPDGVPAPRTASAPDASARR
jgi:hypothetical protein